QKIKDLNIPIREYIRRCDYYIDVYDDRKAMAKGEKPIPEMKPSREYASNIIWAKETGKHVTIHGNVKNTGLIPNLPDGCCVEIPVLVNKNGLQPTYFGEIPPQLAAINKWHINIQELVIKAVIEKRKDYIYHAALLDPLANAVLTVDQIIAMTDELIEAYSYITSEFSDYKKY
ncbi:MAG: alpha-glucosidase/alpha-galactosidase, partial [Desulfobacterales bacterium]|nr:alpha-glucosidase/alpha-galactosidase [Desulfobacterales bacterium]